MSVGIGKNSLHEDWRSLWLCVGRLEVKGEMLPPNSEFYDPNDLQKKSKSVLSTRVQIGQLRTSNTLLLPLPPASMVLQML